MASFAQIISQPYIAGARGALKARAAIACRLLEDALHRAERAYQGGIILGARIVRAPAMASTDPVETRTSRSTRRSGGVLERPAYRRALLADAAV